MVNQYIWVAIVVGVFFVGIGVSYAMFSNTYDPMTMKFQTQDHFDQMMSNNPKMTSQWMNTEMNESQFQQHMTEMVQNPEQMRQWMDDSEHVHEMVEVMKENHDFMMEMMQIMMEDPELRLQMMGHMTEHPEMMEEMRGMMSSGMMGGMINP